MKQDKAPYPMIVYLLVTIRAVFPAGEPARYLAAFSGVFKGF